MINYSIVMRAVNSNLLEINKAKARVNKAKEAGVEPNSDDVEMANTTLVNKAYANAQYSDVMTIEKFAKHIATHGCVYSRADISAILYLAVDCMRELLLEGKKIRLGDLGDFSVNIQSKGAESAEKFTSQNITAVNVVWDCGDEFKNLLADAEFNLVATRTAQAAVLKAIKEGKTTVELSSPSGDNGQQTTDNGQSPSGDNSQQTTDNSQNPSGNTPNGGNPSGGQQTTDNGQTQNPGTGGSSEDDGLI